MGIMRPKRQQILGTFLGSEPDEDEAENTERAIERRGGRKGRRERDIGERKWLKWSFYSQPELYSSIKRFLDTSMHPEFFSLLFFSFPLASSAVGTLS